jgi:hypothetical protein
VFIVFPSFHVVFFKRSSSRCIDKPTLTHHLPLFILFWLLVTLFLLRWLILYCFVVVLVVITMFDDEEWVGAA